MAGNGLTMVGNGALIVLAQMSGRGARASGTRACDRTVFGGSHSTSGNQSPILDIPTPPQPLPLLGVGTYKQDLCWQSKRNPETL